MMRPSHITRLLNLQEVPKRQDVNGLRQLHNKAQVHIRSLKSLGVQADTYSLFLKPIILSKIPQELSVQFFCIDNQSTDDDKLAVEDLLDFVLRDIEGRELNQFLRKTAPINSGIIQNQPKNSKLLPKAAQLAALIVQLQKQQKISQKHVEEGKKSAPAAAKTATRPCLFCKELHFITYCPMSKAQKTEILDKEARCLRCFAKEHPTDDCTRGKPCYRCKDNHHTALCDKPKNKIHVHCAMVIPMPIKDKPHTIAQTCEQDEKRVRDGRDEVVTVQEESYA